MITVLLQGRTGNNLFQYAAGRCLAHRLGTTLRLDASWLPPGDASQARHITRLPINADFVSRIPNIKRAFRKFSGLDPTRLHRGHVLKEPDPPMGFIPTLQDSPDGTLLSGFFQCSQYADGVEAELRNELDLSSIALPTSALKYLRQIETSTSVSLHVRRGDYLSIPGTQCLESNYYEQAVAHFRAYHEDIRFFVFSDDIQWCREHFKGEEFTFVEIQESMVDPMFDIRLMSSCSHHIIVNSSYSWWGAWLNPSSVKTVIAPERWMTKLPSSRIVPPEWILL
jgi:hypothetical protein